MNEIKKDILNYVMCFLLGVTVTLEIGTPIIVSSSRRTDIKFGELSARLQESNRRCAALEYTIESCREPVERIADFTTRGDGTLTGIIENLKQIRSEVQILEERFYNFDNNRNSNNSVDDRDLEKIGGQQ